MFDAETLHGFLRCTYQNGLRRGMNHVSALFLATQTCHDRLAAEIAAWKDDLESKQRRKKIVLPIVKGEREHWDATRLIVSDVAHWPGFHVGFIPPGSTARQVHEGPLVAGPWCYTFGISGVIDNRGGTRAELDQARDAGLLVEAMLGDVIEVCGYEYRIEADHNHNIKLVAC